MKPDMYCNQNSEDEYGNRTPASRRKLILKIRNLRTRHKKAKNAYFEDDGSRKFRGLESSVAPLGDDDKSENLADPIFKNQNARRKIYEREDEDDEERKPLRWSYQNMLVDK